MSEVKYYDATPEGESRVFEMVMGPDFDRVTAERDALQQRLTAADERADQAVTIIGKWREIFGESMAHRSELYVMTDAFLAALKPAEGGGDESAHDRAYRNGLMQGYNLAINGSEKEYQDAVARYSGDKDAE